MAKIQLKKSDIGRKKRLDIYNTLQNTDDISICQIVTVVGAIAGTLIIFRR